MSKFSLAQIQSLSKERRQEFVAKSKAYPSRRQASRALGIPETTLRVWDNEIPEVSLPQFPEDDLPIEEIIESMSKRFEKRAAHKAAKKWFQIKMPDDRPIAMVFVGDPHLDDNGCAWPLLRRHIDLMKTDGVYACNIGDTTNAWADRLVKLWANQDTSKETSWKLAKWFLTESGIRWLVHLLGNHDLWGDTAKIMREMGRNLVPMEDWQAQFHLAFPGGRKCKIWASHQFAGHSMWNTMHGPQKAAHMKDEADIYACGHTHNWAIHQEESASRDFTYWLIRSRGYKFLDEYADRLGHFSQDEGASIATIINPGAKSPAAFVQCFADMDSGIDYLKFLRRKK